MTWPPISTSPESGMVEPAATAMSVDFPAPFSPTSGVDLARQHFQADALECRDAGIGLDDVGQAESGAGRSRGAADLLGGLAVGASGRRP